MEESQQDLEATEYKQAPPDNVRAWQIATLIFVLTLQDLQRYGTSHRSN